MSKEKILVVNSKDKQSGTNGDFTVQFNDSSCQQVQKVLVKEIFVPNLFYNIENDGNRKNNTLVLSQNGLPNITVTIPEGQYNVDLLMTALKTAIDTVLIDGAIVTVTRSSTTFKLTFTFSGAGTAANNNVQFFVAGSTIANAIGLENDTASSNILVMDNIYNLIGSEYVQVHSPQVGEVHGLDAGASGYISLVDTISLSNTPFGGTAYKQNNDDELAEILYEQPKNLSRISIVLRDEQGNKLSLPNNSNCSIMLKIYFD
jgi:hypothetical protein